MGYKILITGNQGYVGSRLSVYLKKKDKNLEIYGSDIGYFKKYLIKRNTEKKNIFKQYNDDNFLYFIHSYYIEPSENEIVTSQCIYEGMKINASVQKKNIYGVQFHPEKSGDIGLNILKNFIEQ